MDVHKIFDSFEPNEISISNNDDYYEILYIINSFNKIFLNSNNIKTKISYMFKKISPELDLEDVKKAGEYLYVKKLWSLIEKININSETHCLVLKLKSGSKYSYELENNIHILIKYFEVSEEYEKCAFLIKIINKIKEFYT